MKKDFDDDQIDTSAKKKDEKDEEEPEEAWTKLTPEELEQIDDKAYDMADAELKRYYEMIVKKAEFLTRLNVPVRFRSKDHRVPKTLSVLHRTASTLGRQESESEARLKESEAPDEVIGAASSWQTRLAKWREYQSSRGLISTLTERKTEIWNSGINSILALLQTDVEAERIQELIEKKIIDGSRRVAGLVLLKNLIKHAPSRKAIV